MTERIFLFAFSLDGVRLALPMDAVGNALAACERVPLPGAPASVAGAVNLHGEIVPILDLRSRLQVPARRLAASDYFVTVQVGDRTVALIASDIEGAIEIAADAIAQPPQHARSRTGVRGLVALADGLLLIEEPSAFLAPEEMQALARSLDAAGEG
jgi:purine-binding chemotaxis protein CheW